MKEKTKEKRFCGNCDTHSAYSYPKQVFCMKLFREKKDPIVEALWHCEDWKQSNQECNCVEDAKKE